jgi:hypothetical protein
MRIWQRIVIVLILGVVLWLPSPEVEPTRAASFLYVTPGGVASGSCTETAPCDLRYAVETVAAAGDYVFVESGTYTDSTPGLDEFLYIDKTLNIFGSCDFSISPFLCDSRKHDSILDAENTKRVVTIAGTGDEEVYFWGFNLRNGNADGVSTGACNASMFAPLEGCGGGMNASDLSYLYLRNNVFLNNVAGDALPHMSYLSLGGGLYLENITEMLAEGNIFRFNYAAYQGLGLGGGAFVLNSGSADTDIHFRDNIFQYNEVSTSHDGWGAGLMSTQDTNLILESNHFSNNNVAQQRLADGAAVFLDSSSFEMKNNYIADNHGFSTLNIEGGHFWGEVIWNHFWNNQTAYHIEIIGHGTVYVYHNFMGLQPVTHRGGSSTHIRVFGDGAYMLNAIIRHNSMAYAGTGVSIGPDSDVIIDKNIFSDHSVKAINNSGATGASWSVVTNLFFDNADNDIPGSNPLYGNPGFVDALNGDLHLTVTSAAIDQVMEATPRFSEDIDGETMPIVINDAITPYDLGADEFSYRTYLPLVLN